MSGDSLWQQIISDGKLLDQLPKHERDALRYEVHLSPRCSSNRHKPIDREIKRAR